MESKFPTHRWISSFNFEIDLELDNFIDFIEKWIGVLYNHNNTWLMLIDQYHMNLVRWIMNIKHTHPTKKTRKKRTKASETDERKEKKTSSKIKLKSSHHCTAWGVLFKISVYFILLRVCFIHRKRTDSFRNLILITFDMLKFWYSDIREHNEQSACMISISCAHHGRWYGVLATVGEQLIHFIEISTTSQINFQQSEKTHRFFYVSIELSHTEEYMQVISTLFEWVIKFIWKCKIQGRRKDTSNYLNSTIITITES